MKKAILFVLAGILLIMTACSAPSAPGTAAPQDNPAQAAPPAAPAAAAITAKLSHSLSNTSQYQAGAEEFKKLVEEKTNGAVKIDIYPNNQLGAERESFEGLKLGTIELACGIASVMGQVTGLNGDVFSLPWLADNEKDFFKLMDSDLTKEILAPTKDSGFEVMAAYNAGFRQLSNSKHPVNSLADVKGLKIRCPESDMYMNTMKALGISASPLAWSEVFTSLQTGVIDGQETPVVVFCTSGLPEVQKYLAITNYMNDPVLFCASNIFMGQLSPEQQSIVRSAAMESALFERKFVADNEQTLLDKAVADFGLEVTYPDTAPFKEAVKSVHTSYKDQELLKKINDFLATLQ